MADGNHTPHEASFGQICQLYLTLRTFTPDLSVSCMATEAEPPGDWRSESFRPTCQSTRKGWHGIWMILASSVGQERIGRGRSRDVVSPPQRHTDGW
jgi:hypothetical protein